MYQEFIQTCGRVAKRANEEASQMQCEFANTGHALIAIADDDNSSSGLLQSFGCHPQRLRAEVNRLSKSGKTYCDKLPPLTEIIDGATRYALSRRLRNAGPELLLLVLLNDQDGIVAQVLQAVNIDHEGLRLEALKRLTPDSAEEIARRKSIEDRFRVHPDVIELKHNLAELQTTKADAIGKQDFELAASCRDSYERTSQKLKYLYEKLDQQG